MHLHPIYTAAALGVLITAVSCTSTSSSNTEPDDVPLAVAFSADNSSRALVETNGDLEGSKAGFVVWGEFRPTNNAEATPTRVFTATPVKYTNSSWSYTDTQYWFPSMTYSFAALFPANVAADADYKGGTQTQLTGYDVVTNRGVDLLGASAVRETRVGLPQGVVTFKFKHLLAQINFVAKVNPSVQHEVVIERAVVYGIPSAGTWSGYDVAGTAAWTADNSSATTSTRPLGELEAAVSVSPADKDGKPLFDKAIPLLCIPQTVPDKAVFELTYHYADTPDNSRTYHYNLKLASTTLVNGWESGGNYRYAFEIGSDDFILFGKPEVVPWDEKSGSNIIIQGDETN